MTLPHLTVYTLGPHIMRFLAVGKSCIVCNSYFLLNPGWKTGTGSTSYKFYWGWRIDFKRGQLFESGSGYWWIGALFDHRFIESFGICSKSLYERGQWCCSKNVWEWQTCSCLDGIWRGNFMNLFIFRFMISINTWFFYRNLWPRVPQQTSRNHCC